MSDKTQRPQPMPQQPINPEQPVRPVRKINEDWIPNRAVETKPIPEPTKPPKE